MARVAVVFENEKNRERVCEMLAYGGIEVNLACRSGGEAIRTVHKMGSGLVVCSHKMSDITVHDLCYSLSGIGVVLVIGSLDQLDMCSGDNLFKLPTPLSRSDLLTSCKMLMQLEEQFHSKMIPTRAKDDGLILESAKLLLMERNLMTEDQAHRFIQKCSMDQGAKMVDTAKRIIATAS